MGVHKPLCTSIHSGTTIPQQSFIAVSAEILYEPARTGASRAVQASRPKMRSPAIKQEHTVPERSLKDVLSHREFRMALDLERARADRTEQEFSVLLLKGAAVADSQTAECLMHRLLSRIRITDIIIGWYDEHRIGIILPYTPSSGAVKLARDIDIICKPSRSALTVYTYPGPWLPEDDSNSEARGHSSDQHTVAENEGDTLWSAYPVSPPQILFDTGMPRWKRAMDIAGSAIALAILSPLLLIVATIIAVVSPGPIFLKQKRVGYQGKPYYIWKFRTMKVGTDNTLHQEHFKTLMNDDVPLTKLDTKGDPRVIPLGNFIRRCYLDELPQLINVLRGDMSLVGPRPCLAYTVSQYRPWQRRRCDAVPGMTGLWQVSGKNKTTFKQMVRLDIAYVRQRSLSLDLWILWRTFPTILGELFETVLASRTTETNLDNSKVSVDGD